MSCKPLKKTPGARWMQRLRGQCCHQYNDKMSVSVMKKYCWSKRQVNNTRFYFYEWSGIESHIPFLAEVYRSTTTILTTAILWCFFYKYVVFVRPTLPCLQHSLCKIVLLKVWFFQKLLELSLQLLYGMLAYQRFAYKCNKRKVPSICHSEISSPCKKQQHHFVDLIQTWNWSNCCILIK